MKKRHKKHGYAKNNNRKRVRELILMLNIRELEICRAAVISSCDTNALTDLKNITVDTAKPVRERMESFVEQVKNPYLFKVGDTVIKVAYGGERDISLVLAELICEG